MLAYYRSQHANQSWLAALTAILDVSALLMLASENGLKRQAEFTFAAGRARGGAYGFNLPNRSHALPRGSVAKTRAFQTLLSAFREHYSITFGAYFGDRAAEASGHVRALRQGASDIFLDGPSAVDSE